MNLNGELRKMQTSLNDVVHYELALYDTLSSSFLDKIDMNALIGKNITLQFDGVIHCKSCGKKTNKSFLGGFCYNCFRKAPEASECIIHPERCRGHLGEGRNVEWEEKNHNQPHYVYLAAVDVVKVGVTRAAQIPTRWIDQGAGSAIRLAETPNRYLAGTLEVALKDSFTDKTNWRKMLSGEEDEAIDLEELKWEMEELLPNELSAYFSENDEVTVINYPVNEYPTKVKSINLEKTPSFSGVLKGIRGQYLIFDSGAVFNVRKHTGFNVNIDVE